MARYDFTPQACWYKDVCESYNTDACDKYCLRFSQMSHMITHSRLPDYLCYPTPIHGRKADMECYKQLASIKSDIVNFVQGGNNIIIYSKNYCNGKTLWASRLMLKYFEGVYYTNGFACRGLFINVPTLLQCNLYDPNFQKLKYEIQRVDLVIWDDITPGIVSNKDFSRLYSLINDRIINGRSNIFTAVCAQEELSNILGEALASKIWTRSVHIEFLSPVWEGLDGNASNLK